MDGGHAGPTDPARRQEWRSARRAVLRAHHPDRGGDPAVMQAALADVDRRYSDPTPPASGRPRARRRLRAAARAVRARLPTGWPGHRRYIDL